MPKIRDILIESNPWWKDEFTFDYQQRQVFTEIKKYLPMPQIIALTGLRRVGKTTLMYKIIDKHLKNGFNKNKILYFSFDEFKDAEIRDILSEFEQIMHQNITQASYLVLFDEIQKLKNWDEQLKRIYDTYQKNVKIIISGSESLFIKQKSKATLAGRLFEFTINPLSFKEYLDFKKIRITNIDIYKKKLLILFQEYIKTQGFPELVGITDKDIIKKYIKESIIEKIIYRDLTRLLNINNIPLLESILTIIMEEPGQIIELSKLSRDLDISRQTLSNYMRYLEDSFLIHKLYNYSNSKRKVERKLKKYYPTILSPTLLFKTDSLSQSKVFESILVNQLNAEYFYRDPYKNEVDIIQLNEPLKPIEIKYGKIETEGLLKFMDKKNIKQGIVLTNTIEDTKEFNNKIIQMVPAYKFLLEQDNHTEKSKK
ncbi:MAG: ATP-binding protein [Thermoplasmatota archaeon]